MSGLAGNGVGRGLDKSFAQVGWGAWRVSSRRSAERGRLAACSELYLIPRNSGLVVETI